VEGSTALLDPKAAKIGKRTIPLEGPLRQIIERRIRARRFDCSLIFHRTSKGQPGQPVKDFVRQWRAALKVANLPAGLLPYDLRRSALRNTIRGGTDFTVAMRISGHRTRSTFDRYNIVSEEDLRAAVTRTAAYVSQLPTERNVVAMPGRSGDERGQNTDNGASAASPARPRLSTDQEVTSEGLAEAGGNRNHETPDGGADRVDGATKFWGDSPAVRQSGWEWRGSIDKTTTTAEPWA
jgi:hypothetical protein